MFIDNSGAVVVKYVYDAWGNHAVEVLDSTCTALSELNPYLYRGYYYDTETGLYYLKTRYYDPEIGRFITIDDLQYLDPETINGLNLYAYCGNNPVMNVDPEGTFSWKKFWKKVVGVVSAVALAVVTVAGVIASGGALLIPVLIGAGLGAVTSFVGQGLSNVFTGKNFFDNISAFSIVMGALTGAAFATGMGGFWGTVAIGAVSNVGIAAWENKSGAEIAWSGFYGGMAAGIGYSLRTLISGKMFNSMGNTYFKDFVDIARLDTNMVSAVWHAFKNSWTVFLPNLANLFSKTITNEMGKLSKKIKQIFKG